MAAQYQYKPLNPDRDEIRVIDAVTGANELQYHIQHISLASNPRPRYKTISYHWGDPTLSCTIVVDGRSLRVPSSAAKALRQTANHCGECSVWLDAVCIDQGNVDERERQVALMGRVFASSAGNVVYLGEEDEFVERALLNIAACQREIYATLATGQDFFDVVCRDDNYVYADEPSNTLDDEEAVLGFFSRPWFSRAWIVQEVVLSPSSQYVCGIYHGQIDQILEAAVWWVHRHYPHASLAVRRSLGMYHAANIWQHRANIARYGAAAIGEVLRQSWDLQASDQRDKVFGMIGLTMIGEDGPVPALLAPDYSKTIARVYCDAVRHHITSSENTLFLLRYIDFRSDEQLGADGFPTWVPRFDRSRLDNEVDSFVLRAYDNSTCKEEDAVDMELAADTSELDVLVLRGLVLGSINMMSRVFDADVLLDFAELDQELQHVERLAARARPMRAESHRLLIADTDDHGREASCAASIQGYQAMLNMARAGVVPDAPAMTEQSFIRDKYRQAFVQAAQHRRVALTDSGLIGLMPMIARGDDMVVALRCSRKPFLLRQISDGSHYILGECYVDGLMPNQENFPELRQRLSFEENQVFRLH